MQIKLSSRKILRSAAAIAVSGVVTMGFAQAGEFNKQEQDDIRVRTQTAADVSTAGLTGRTGTRYTTTNVERVQTHGLTGRTNTSYQPALNIGHSNGLTGRTNF